jgi:hypothetical protein
MRYLFAMGLLLLAVTAIAQPSQQRRAIIIVSEQPRAAEGAAILARLDSPANRTNPIICRENCDGPYPVVVLPDSTDPFAAFRLSERTVFVPRVWFPYDRYLRARVFGGPQPFPRLERGKR